VCSLQESSFFSIHFRSSKAIGYFYKYILGLIILFMLSGRKGSYKYHYSLPCWADSSEQDVSMHRVCGMSILLELIVGRLQTGG
jgi:hypothetical protein